MDCKSSAYCHKCKGMLWSFFGVLLVINAFVWPKWHGVDGWFAFLGILLMLGGVWKSFIHGCACSKDTCCKTEEKPVHIEEHHEFHAEPIVVEHHKPAHHAKKRKK